VLRIATLSTSSFKLRNVVNNDFTRTTFPRRRNATDRKPRRT